jgi:hypothetical protein
MRKRFLFLPTNLHELTRILKKEKKKPIFNFKEDEDEKT